MVTEWSIAVFTTCFLKRNFQWSYYGLKSQGWEKFSVKKYEGLNRTEDWSCQNIPKTASNRQRFEFLEDNSRRFGSRLRWLCSWKLTCLRAKQTQVHISLENNLFIRSINQIETKIHLLPKEDTQITTVNTHTRRLSNHIGKP